MEFINFNMVNDKNTIKLESLCEKFNLFPNNDIKYCVNNSLNSNYLNISIKHFDRESPYTKITCISPMISLKVDGDFTHLMQWVIGIILPGLCQPSLPGVDITDILPLLKNSSLSTQEFIDDDSSSIADSYSEASFKTGALFIFYTDFSNTTDFNNAFEKQKLLLSEPNRNLLLIPSVPNNIKGQGDNYFDFLKDFYPLDIKKYIQRLVFYSE